MTMSNRQAIGVNEKQMLANEIDGIDRRIRSLEKSLSDMHEKRKAFELIRLTIWDMGEK